MTSSGPVGRQAMIEKRYFEPTVKELYNFERSSFEKQTRSCVQGVSFSFKVPNKRCMKKSESVVSSVKRNSSDTDLKPSIRTIVRSKSSSELLEKAVSETTKTTLISKLASDSNFMQDSCSEKELNTPECKADGGPPIKMNKKVDSKKKVLGKTISATPSHTANNGATGSRNKCFPGAICSSRLSAALNRNSEWEKLAMKSRSIFLKHRSQKMLKDRLEKYCVIKQKSHNSERSNTTEASQTPTAPYLMIKEAPPKFNQNFFDLFFNHLNEEKVEQSETSCESNESKTLVEKNMPSKRNLNHEIGLQDTKKIPFSSLAETQPLTAIDRNSGKVMDNRSGVKRLSLISDTKDAAEIEVTKEVESLVKKALLQTTVGSCFRTNQDLRKSGSDSVQEGHGFDMTNDDAKLKKMWTLVAEESSLTNNLNDISAKINKIKADLCALSNESFQITKRLDEVRFLKNQLLNNSHCKSYSDFQP
ncbi:hypothetical protein LOAG_18575 [Loa loa]|uniref:Uncharacterized protein n=1 Tax=Loa loa TaxID=7209 RepID=A0A1S0UF60_LOALO|nr:hypothetical protein LOAG_18575 [Loa loa]EJD74056.1 hypothetical protein LOAG_18575 [Loa loa]